MLKLYLKGIIISLGIASGLGVFLYAWTNISSVNDNDELTASLINNIIDKINGVNYISGSKLLEVSGTVIYSDSTVDCDNDIKGAIQFSGTDFYFCKGSGWETIQGRECRDGILDPGEECDDGNNIDDDACNNSCVINDFSNSCVEILADDNSSLDGIYTVDPDGTGPLSSYEIYCDMTNGGWTLIGMTKIAYSVPQGKDFLVGYSNLDSVAPTNLNDATSPYFSKATYDVDFRYMILEQYGTDSYSNQYDLGKIYSSLKEKMNDLVDETGYIVPTVGRYGSTGLLPARDQTTTLNDGEVNFALGNDNLNNGVPYCWAMRGNRFRKDPREYAEHTCGRSGLYADESCYNASESTNCSIVGNMSKYGAETERDDILRIWVK